MALLRVDYIQGWVCNLAVGILAVIGSILAFLSKKAGGVLLLVAGLISIVLGIIFAVSGYTHVTYWQYSYFATWGVIAPLSNLFAGISLEALIITTGGIICLVSRSN